MLFAIVCHDKPDSLSVRMDNRPEHVAYLKEYNDRIVIAGPMLSEDGESPIGSLLIMDLDDLAAAQAFAAGDPFAKAGLFESVSIRPYRKTFPQA